MYSGATAAPFGDLNSAGWRVRLQAGTGIYSFRGQQKKSDLTGYEPLSYSDRVSHLDALVGYSAQFGPITAKAFAGAAFVEHDVDGPIDFIAEFNGRDVGPKAQLELWYDPGGPMWASVNAGYTTVLDTYDLNSRVGWRLWDNWSAGLETNLNHRLAKEADLAGAYASGGLFLRYTWDSGEISLSGGLALDLDSDPDIVIDDEVSPYISVAWQKKF